jgi:hypothetical protein
MPGRDAGARCRREMPGRDAGARCQGEMPGRGAGASARRGAGTRVPREGPVPAQRKLWRSVSPIRGTSLPPDRHNDLHSPRAARGAVIIFRRRGSAHLPRGDAARQPFGIKFGTTSPPDDRAARQGGGQRTRRRDRRHRTTGCGHANRLFGCGGIRSGESLRIPDDGDSAGGSNSWRGAGSPSSAAVSRA